MRFTQEQLQAFAAFHEAKGRGEAPKLNHAFATEHGLQREDLVLFACKRAELEAAARAAGLIA